MRNSDEIGKEWKSAGPVNQGKMEKNAYLAHEHGGDGELGVGAVGVGEALASLVEQLLLVHA